MTKKTKPQKMPKFIPAPAQIVTLFHQNVDGLPNVELRKMFGYPCAFINGQMLTGVFANHIMLRLSEEDRTRIIQTKRARQFEPTPGRPIREYVELSEEVIRSKTEFNEWLIKGVEYVNSLPPKIKEKRRK